MFLVEQLLNGLTLGSLYGLVALGLALMLGVARFVNLAHGEVMMIGAYLLVVLFKRGGLPYAPAVVVVVLLLALTGSLVAVGARRLLRASWRTQLVATLAAAVILEAGVITVHGAVPQVVPTRYTGSVLRLGPLALSVQRVLVFVVVAAGFTALQLFLSRSKQGKAMRAVAQHRDLALALGIDPNRVAVLTFGVAFALAGLAGALLSPLYAVYPAMGTAVTFKALAAVVMGGFGQVVGAFVAALLLGVVESLAGGMGWAAYQDALAFVMMIAVLLFRPQGFFGARVRA